MSVDHRRGWNGARPRSAAAGAAVRRGELAVALRSPAQAPHWLAFASQMLHDPFCSVVPALVSPARRTPARLAACAAAHATQCPAEPSLVPRRVRRGALTLPDPRTGRIDHGCTRSVSPGELRCRRAAITVENLVPNLEPPSQALQWFTHGVRNIPCQSLLRFEPLSTVFGVLRGSLAAGTLSPVTCAAARAPISPEPPDPDPMD